MADLNNGNNTTDNTAEQQRKTYERLQNMHRAWDTHDNGDKALAAAEEYLADSTYRESEEAGAANKLNRYANTAALFSTDCHLGYNEDVYDRLTDTQKMDVFTEYTAAAEATLKNEVFDYGKIGRTAEDLYKQGFVTYDRDLSATELNKLQSWLDDPTAIANQNIISDLNSMYGLDISLSNMTAARARIMQIVDEKKLTQTVMLSQEALNAAQVLSAKNSTKTNSGLNDLSSTTKSQMIDTVRAKRLDKLKENDDILRQFMEEHPNATAADWRHLINHSKAQHGLPVTSRTKDDLKPVKALSTLSEKDIPVISADTVTALEDTFGMFGEVTGSTGLYKRDAGMGALNFFLGDMASVTNTGYMIGRAGYNLKEAAYKRWLEKSKDASTANYRQKMSEARQGLRSDNAATRYDSRNRVKDVKRERRYERQQTKRHGSDRSKWDKYSTKRHKNFDDTLKGKFLSKLNRNPIGKALGKVFNIKNLLANAIKKLAMGALKWLGMGILGLIWTAIQWIPLITIVFYVLAAFSNIFSAIKPEYAQNCINNLNVLDKMYMKAVENEVKLIYEQQKDGEFTGETWLKSKDYQTYIKLDTTQVGQFVNEYGEEIASGNNILPIFMAFKQRTGCDIDRDTYVAASAYGQMMYWRTHKIQPLVDDDSSYTHFDYSSCETDTNKAGCGNYKHNGGEWVDNGQIPKKEYCNDYWPSENFKLASDHQEGIEVCSNHTVEGYTIMGMYKCRKIEHPQHTSSCYGAVQICAGITDAHPEHDSSCYTTGIICGLPIHTHDTTIAKYGTGTEAYYDSPCLYVHVKCLGHCTGHATAQMTIRCIMDIENIVKLDDLVFTEDALTYGSTVVQWAGTVEKDWTTFITNVSDWWKKALGSTDLYDLNDFYNTYVLDTTYGAGNNEASMFRSYSDTNKKAIFYDNYSLFKQLKSTQDLNYILSHSDTSALEFNFGTVDDTNTTTFPFGLNTRKNTEHLGIKSIVKNKYKIYNTSENDSYDSTNYLSPFLFDSFSLDGRYYTFKNGWGFYQQMYRPGGYVTDYDSWTWCVNLDFLQSVTGTYDDGYQYAVTAFYEESGLYFNNAVPGADLSKSTNSTMKKVVKALKQMEENYPFKGADERVATMATAFKHLFGYMKDGFPSGTRTSSYYYNYSQNGVSLDDGTLLSRKYIVNTELLSGDSQGSGKHDWKQNTYGYYYLYVICEADKAGNWGAGEKYYYCLIYDPNVDSQFRFVTMSSTSLKLYEKSYHE